ncbi:PLD nuclease N-terminal domain-containing protein [Microbacterium sp. NPDC096154]|uniref:PLD nuclease N-terminal domain-containing protein n=1 Tax=Microbacterium sp. NPDC096154 TaxID=3155549 RepID=UPI00331B6645
MVYVVPLLMLAFSIVTLIDIITRENWQVKHLPKVAWIILAIIIPFVGGICWWAVGREYPERPARAARPRSEAWSAGAPVRIVDGRGPDTRTTEQQLADLEREIEEERLRAEIARRRAERGEA